MRQTYPGIRVLLVAEFDDALHAHAALRRRALERLGCTVSAFNLLGAGGWLSRLRGAGLQDRLARTIAQVAPAVVLVLEGTQLTVPVVAALRRENGARWVNWMCDGHRSVEAVESVAPGYDAVFVGGSELAVRLCQVGAPPVGYLPPGCDPSVHRPLRSRDQFRANVVFAGTATPYREQVLSELVPFGLAVWGPGWRRTRLRDYCRGELLDHGNYIRAYAGASVALDVPCREEAEPDPGCPRRMFELAAIGVPQVGPDRPDLHRHFQEGSEVLVYRSPGELRRLVSEALHDRAWAEQVAAAARQRALSEHTYVHRVTELLGCVVRED